MVMAGRRASNNLNETSQVQHRLAWMRKSVCEEEEKKRDNRRTARGQSSRIRP